jgi:arylsulfatase A-like enzyme
MGQIDDLYRRRLRSLQAVDDLLATLVTELQNAGQLGRTYLFFTSDNGFHMGEHRLLPGKNTAYEEDIRVPMLVRGPGVPAGRVVPHMALNIDIAPTFADLAGVAVPGWVDGRSFAGLLGGAPPPVSAWRQAFMVEHYLDLDEGAGGARPRPRARAIPELHALRASDYAYIEYATGDRELYDLRTDPYELRNLVAAADPGLLRQLAARLAVLKRCQGATCRAAEDAGVPPVAPR